MSQFAAKLTALRKERKLSQKVVAADLNISQGLLSHYEKGVRECSLDLLITIADYFGVSCDYLLGCTDVRHRVFNTGSQLANVCSNLNGIVLTFDKAKDKRLADAVEKYLLLSMYHLAAALDIKSVDTSGFDSLFAFDISEMMKRNQLYNIATLAAESAEVKKAVNHIDVIIGYAEKCFGGALSEAARVMSLQK
ncbi:MAG: helix-turn-helix transcriptional regulator [Clostridia bacterium]|nr:helix-turn-helix transcriptional regulator [Clostridia bacterium]